jgi:endonuclease IV
MVEQYIGMHMCKTGCKTMSEKLILLAGVFPELDAVQIFSHGPQTWGANKFDPELRSVADDLGINLHVHGSYMCNPWNDKPNVLEHTVDNFRVAHKYGAKCVVLHMPKTTVDKIVSGLAPLVEQIKKEKLSPYIMLEMKSLKYHPTESMESPEKINQLTELIFQHKFENYIRICIDTAHIDAGQAQIKTYKQGKKYIGDLDRRLIGLIHLNGNGYDSTKRAGDKHEVPLSASDKIWGDMDYIRTGCKVFIDFAMISGIDVIMEVHDCHTHESIREFIDKVV